MMKTTTLLLSLASAITTAFADSTFTPARPPSVPLAVRSPYLSTWLPAGSDGGNGGYLAGEWPSHWGGQITGWAGLIRVDNTSYIWMGKPDVDAALATQTAFTYTATKSIFTFDVDGKVELNVTFTSPVTPHSFKRQSLPFTYLHLDVESSDGAAHDVQLYTDISAEWVSGEEDANAQWSYGTTSGVAYHKVWRQTQLEFSENMSGGQGIMADWGNWYYATTSESSLTYQQAADVTVRGAFVDNGKLGDTQNNTFRPINEDYPVFGYAWDLGSVSGAAPGTLLSLGYLQEEAVQFNGTDGYQQLKSLWTSYFSNELSALSWVHKDYKTATKYSNEFDSKIQSESVAAAGQNYATITTLSVRQAFAGLVPAIRNSTNTYWFLKEISSDGNADTVDVVFPTFPILYYTNPEILKGLLDPLFENQESGDYPNAYAEHDIGSHFPNATGHPLGDDEMMPVEECGNMLIMTLAYAQKTGNNGFLSAHYPKLKQWVEYLIEDSLIPGDQLSTDDFAGHLPNQTNLALKGIIGIGAMAEIASKIGNTADAENYTNISTTYISKWQDYGIAKDANPPHTTLEYGNDSTHGLLYNLYGDKILNLSLVPQSVYDMQSAFYPTVVDTYGIALDTRSTATKSDWQVWTAAVSSSSTCDTMLKLIAGWINTTTTYRPSTDLYNAATGGLPDSGTVFTARPVVGGHFAILAIQ